MNTGRITSITGSWEPLNSVVWVKDNGAGVEAWVGTQAPVYTIKAIAKATGVDESPCQVAQGHAGRGFRPAQHQ